MAAVTFPANNFFRALGSCLPHTQYTAILEIKTANSTTGRVMILLKLLMDHDKAENAYLTSWLQRLKWQMHCQNIHLSTISCKYPQLLCNRAVMRSKHSNLQSNLVNRNFLQKTCVNNIWFVTESCRAGYLTLIFFSCERWWGKFHWSHDTEHSFNVY